METAERAEFTEAFRQAFVPGPVRVLSDSDPAGDLTLMLRVEGFVVEQTSTDAEMVSLEPVANVLLDLVSTVSIDDAVARAKRLCTDALLVRCEASARDTVYARLFAHGFRRHPREVLAVPHHRLDVSRRLAYLILERTATMPPAGVDDPLYRVGRLADAQLFHFEWASRYVRFNDRVLVVGKHSGAGGWIIQSIRPGVRALCVQPDPVALQWEQQAYANVRLTFQSAFSPDDAERFDCIVVVSDEPTLPSAIEPEVLARRLNPGGRLLWVCPHNEDDTAAVFEQWKALPEPLYAETAWGQTGISDDSTRRRLSQLGLGTDAKIEPLASMDFLLLTAMRKPDLRRPEPFEEHVFPPPSNCAKVPNIIDFAGSYDNPWILHALVFACFRMADPVRLIGWLEELQVVSRPDSADRGASLCVLGYKRELPSNRVDGEYFAEVEAYLAIESESAHIVRWQISLAFICARILRAAGEPEQAEAWFELCYRMPFLKFSPHHLSRTAEAAASAGRLAWLRGDPQAAEAHWRQGLQLLETYRQAPVEDTLVNPEAPALFGRGDGLAEVIVGMDYAQHCAQGVRLLHASTGSAATLSLQQKGFQRTVFGGY
ncbi:MAG: hypothetical protein ACFB20_04425 [Opitutales bacterium]